MAIWKIVFPFALVSIVGRAAVVMAGAGAAPPPAAGAQAAAPAVPAAGASGAADGSDGTSFRIAILGDASIWTTQSASSAPSAFGGGIMISGQESNLSLRIAKGSLDTLDTTSTSHEVGAFLLKPESGKLSMALSGYLSPWLHHRDVDAHMRRSLGIYLNVDTGAATFSIPSTTPGVAPNNMDAVGFAAAAGPIWRLGSDSCTSRATTCWEVDLLAGLIYQQLMGDVGQDDAFRMMALGTSSRIWAGGEIGGGININNVTISMLLKFLPEFLGNSKVDGLTGGQLVPAISVSVPIDVALPPTNAGNTTAPAAAPGAEQPAVLHNPTLNVH